MRKINEKIFDESIVGQTIQIVNDNFNTQFNKISNTNTKDIFINEDSKNFLSKKYKKSKIRYLSIDNNTNNCEDSMTFCLPSEIIKKLLEKENSNNIGFNSQVNKNKNIAIKTNITRKIFSENSLDFELKLDGLSNKRLRNLDMNDFNIRYNIRLKMPDLKKNTSDIGSSLCVQYDKNDQANPNISCETWYDFIANEVICECERQGLTINLMDNTISQFGRVKQFTISKIDFCNIFVF